MDLSKSTILFEASNSKSNWIDLGTFSNFNSSITHESILNSVTANGKYTYNLQLGSTDYNCFAIVTTHTSGLEQVVFTTSSILFRSAGIGSPLEGKIFKIINFKEISDNKAAMAVGNTSGNPATAKDGSISIGYYSKSNGTGSISIGGSASVYSTGSAVVVGQCAFSLGNNGNISIGPYSGVNVSGNYGGIAIGNNARVTLTNGDNSIALGANVTVSSPNTIVLGNSLQTILSSNGNVITSDLRDKIDVKDEFLGLDFINELKPKTYRLNLRDDYIVYENLDKKDINSEEPIVFKQLVNDGSRAGKRYHHGLIAQDLKHTMDKLDLDFSGYIDFSYNGGEMDKLGIKYQELITPMIKAIQELSKKVDLLEAKISNQ